MSMPKTYARRFVVGALRCALAPLHALQCDDRITIGFGQTATPEELAKYFVDPADGRWTAAGQRNGKGRCEASCRELRRLPWRQTAGQSAKGIGGDRLLGGRGTLRTARLRSRRSRATGRMPRRLFDYVKRAMPFNAPGSLSDDEVYSAGRLHPVGSQDHQADRYDERENLAKGGDAQPGRIYF